MDLLDWHRERLSSRRLAVLIKHLPRDSALNRDLHGEAADWSVTDHLLAAAVDHLAAANWMFASVNSEEGDQPEPPVPVPRPGDGAQDADADGEGDGDGNAGPATDTQAAGTAEGADPQAPSPAELARFFA
ncbi:hypothetical protein J7I94_03085 [Streptomyces sp. ISL-12]|uniref:hypothetical protein n=1 Tax=Streptomyces sp. ISL-12 TaxID=2819177 RepID=UPI001BE5F098|nr:hypothetical protein [Streptomyces sp. ISL-12]MBT2409552.1 hypothetical protein [Streptomyces sp. ISL-12]